MKNRQLLFWITITLVFSGMGYACTPTPGETAQEKVLSSPPVVMAYYVPEKDYQPERLPLDQLTHIIFSFTKVIDGEMKFSNEATGEKLRQLVAQRANHPNLKVMIACGGWGADGFSDMALTPEGRKRFIESAVAFLEAYQLDGLDIDWEYPSISGAGTMARPEDKANFTALMQGLREGLDQLARPQTLTFASAGWKRYYDNVELDQVMKYADYMNVMTYDQMTIYSPFTGHHTPLGLIQPTDLQGYPIYEYMQSRNEEPGQDAYPWEPRSVEKIVQYCLDQGVSPEQIVVGAAFYGRAWKGVPPQANGLYQPNQGAYIGWSGYAQIRREFEEKNGFTRYWDSVAQAPYLYRPSDSIFISYDDTASVKLKTRYAKENGLGGIMFWQLGNDTQEANSLLDAIDAAAGN